MQRWSSHEVEVGTSLCLVSTGGNDWLQTGSTRLFVRPCYPALFQECQALFHGSIQGVFLVGTPGIGKSCFLDYALHRFLHDYDQSVLYLVGPRERAYLFRPDGAVVEHNLRNALDNNNIMADEHFDVVLYDPHENVERTNDVHISFFRKKNFIVAMSPDEENCKKLRKDTTARAKLFMGTFSLQEAHDLRSSCYPHLSQELLCNRHKVIGGVARYLIPPLLPNHADMATKEVEEKQSKALNIIAENPLLIDAGEVASQFKSLWSLYHLQPNRLPGDDGAVTVDYYNYTIELCCEDARVRIRDRLMAKAVDDLWSTYEKTHEQHGTLRGIRFEAYAHKKILAAGLHGIASSLTQKGIGKGTIQVSIPASLPKMVLPNNDLRERLRDVVNLAKGRPNGCYLLPHLSNFPVVDSIYVSPTVSVLLQMKAGRSKPLSEVSAAAIRGIVGGDLVFVVPDEFTMQNKLPGAPQEMKQYRFILNETDAYDS